jgi:hypothetical protein
MLIVMGISLLFSIPDLLFGIVTWVLTLGGNFPAVFFVITDVISELLELAAAFITTPLCILFFKNFYLAMKKEKEGKKRA